VLLHIFYGDSPALIAVVVKGYRIGLALQNRDQFFSQIKRIVDAAVHSHTA